MWYAPSSYPRYLQSLIRVSGPTYPDLLSKLLLEALAADHACIQGHELIHHWLVLEAHQHLLLRLTLCTLFDHN